MAGKKAMDFSDVNERIAAKRPVWLLIGGGDLANLPIGHVMKLQGAGFIQAPTAEEEGKFKETIGSGK